MNITIVGDPHGNVKKLKSYGLKKENIDLILVTGDLGSASIARKMAFTNIDRRKKGLEPIEFSNKKNIAQFM